MGRSAEALVDDAPGMAVRIATFDWAETSLGPRSQWPVELRIATALCLDSPLVAAVHWGPQLNILYNDAYALALADKHPRALGLPFHEVWPEGWDVMGPQVRAVVADGRAFAVDAQHLRLVRNGVAADSWWQYTYVPIRGLEGRVGGVAVTAIEVTPQFIAQQQLIASESYLRLLLASTSQGFYAVGRDGVTTLCNPAFLDMLGFAHEGEVIGQKLHGVIHHSHPDGSGYDVADCPIYICAQTGAAAHVTHESFFRRDGSAFPVEYWAHPILRNGALEGAICTFFDISERVATAGALAEALAVKETLLEEVNHRVKNSLQLVMSLLALHAHKADDERLRRGLEDARQRIAVIATIHRELYVGGRHDPVEIGGYLASLLDKAMAAHDAAGRIVFAADVEPGIFVSIDRAIPLALILSEVATNCVKYAFPANADGTVRLVCRRSDDDSLEVSVTDDGVGLPADFDPARSTGLGTRIIKALVRQIHATERFERLARGTAFRIRMALSADAPATRITPRDSGSSLPA